MYKTDNSTVFYRTAEDFYELAMAHGVEEAFKVEVYYIGVALVDYPLRSTQCIMASSSRSEAVACLGELVLIDGRQYLVDALLHHTVYHCRYSQQAHLAVVFGYFYPFHWVRTVRTVHQGTDEHILVGHEPWEQLLTRHLVDTTTAFVSHNSLVSSVEIRRTEDLLEKVFLVEWYFHDVVFTHPHEGLHSPIPFGFRPISLGAAINLG